MKTEYKEIIFGSLFGFMEGNAKLIEDSVKQRFKQQFDLVPTLVQINTFTPYNLPEEGYYTYPVILLTVHIDGESLTLVRDCKREGELAGDDIWKDDPRADNEKELYKQFIYSL